MFSAALPFNPAVYIQDHTHYPTTVDALEAAALEYARPTCETIQPDTKNNFDPKTMGRLMGTAPPPRSQLELPGYL
jgi:hypothetical protein